MIAEDTGHVTDPLKFVFLLVERAVALVDAQRISEGEAAGAVERKRRHSGGVIVVQVQSGDASVLRRRRSEAVRVDEDAVAEKAEAKVAQPRGRDDVIEA